MQILRLLYPLSFLLALGAGLWLMLRWRERHLARRRAAALLKRMDEKYERHIRPRISALSLDGRSALPDRAALLEEALILLAPEIESLASLVRASSEERLRLGYASPNFANVGIVAEECLSLPARDRQGIGEQLRKASADALRADLLREWLCWHPESTGNL